MENVRTRECKGTGGSRARRRERGVGDGQPVPPRGTSVKSNSKVSGEKALWVRIEYWS